MTEAEWLACRDPDALLEFLRAEASARRLAQPSRRKVRLLACACCRRVWAALIDPRSRRAVEVAERYADRRATREELARTCIEARAVEPIGNAGLAAVLAAVPSGWPDRAAAHAALAGDLRRWDAERAAQAGLVRDLFGDPFCPVPVLETAWLAWDGGAIPRLARAIYEERTFHRLPHLAGALAKAGCADPTILAHCREDREHARGCWVLGTLLNKN
jgi:hypothetical protein